MTHNAMSDQVTTGAVLLLRNAVTSAGRRLGALARDSFMHSGQWNPTAAGVWHSPQMVRPQRGQCRKLWRSGCR